MAGLVLLVNGLSPAESPALRSGRVVEVACRVDQLDLVRMARDYYPGRSGDIEIVPRDPDFVAAPGGGVTNEGAGPHLQRVPLLLFGPGYIKRGRTKYRPATTAAISPTIARLVGFTPSSWFPEEAPLSEALRREPAGGHPPKLVVTVVWEGVGRNVLAKWGGAWPNLRQFRDRGAWYDKASAGSSPPAGSAVQATIGTAVYPRTHGIVGDSFRRGHGVVTTWSGGPSDLVVPTFADIYDRAESNRPLVGLVGADQAGLGLIGHGAAGRGGDRDIVALHSPSGGGDRWGPPTAPWGHDYGSVASLDSFPGLAGANRRLDAMDGTRDGRWEGARIAGLAGGFDTPSGIDYETAAVEHLVREQGFGRDGVPDLLFVTYGQARTAQARWGLGSPQMRDSVQALDRSLLSLRHFLNQVVGDSQWVMILTADHGARGNPAVTGGYAIDPIRLKADLQQRFGGGGNQPPVVQAVSPTQIWLNRDTLRRRGYTSYDVSRFLLGYTRAANGAPNGDLSDERVFEAAFPTGLLPRLPCLGS